MVAAAPVALGDAVRRGAAVHEVLPVLLDELAVTPTLMVIEDVHWADEATLDLVVLLARRLSTTKALVVVSCRDDELALDHPLRVVFASLSAAGVERIELAPLSLDAVRRLATGATADGDELFGMTARQPVLRDRGAGGGRAPSCPDRSAMPCWPGRRRSTPTPASCSSTLSVVTGIAPPSSSPSWVATPPTDSVHASTSGMLVAAGRRRGVPSRPRPPGDRRGRRPAAAHRAQPDRPAGPAQPPPRRTARLAHHADEAHDAEALEEFARAPRPMPSRRGAHRQAGRPVPAGPAAAAADRRRGPGRPARAAGPRAVPDRRFDEAIAWLQEAISLRHAAGRRRR